MHSRTLFTFLTAATLLGAACGSGGDDSPTTTEPPVNFTVPEESTTTEPDKSTTTVHIPTTTTNPEVVTTAPQTDADAVAALIPYSSVTPADNMVEQLDIRFQNAEMYARHLYPNDTEAVAARLQSLGMEWATQRYSMSDTAAFNVQIIKFADVSGAERFVTEGWQVPFGQGAVPYRGTVHPDRSLTVEGSSAGRYSHREKTVVSPTEQKEVQQHDYTVAAFNGPYVVAANWTTLEPTDWTDFAVETVERQLKRL